MEDESGESFVAVGVMPQPDVGEWYRIRGRWQEHQRFGRQFRISAAEPADPQGAEGLIALLGSGRIKGVGKTTARRIVDHFGDRTIEVLDTEPDRLMEVEGIGRTKAAAIRQSWEDFRSEQGQAWTSLLYLVKRGIPYNLAHKIYQHYEGRTLQVIKDNPYRLIEDVSGIGFVRADAIARQMGMEEDSPQRMEAAMVHVLQDSAESSGHVYLPASELFSRTVQLLERTSQSEIRFPEDRFEELLTRLEQRGQVVLEHPDSPGSSAGTALRVYLRRLYVAERVVAQRIAAISASESPIDDPGEDSVTTMITEKLGLRADPQQIKAIRTALSSRISIITGGPGTGKTTIIRAIVTYALEAGLEVNLAAPTGRAAKRLSESTGQEASTIHRLLQYNPATGFMRNGDNPLLCDILIVDEVSMVDIGLMRRLMEAVLDEAIVVLVGDHNQLPSVGPGAVLRDLIDSGRIPVVKLVRIFRQAAESFIVKSAHAVLSGAGVRTGQGSSGDFGWVVLDEAQDVADRVVRLVTKELPNYYGFSPNDIQVLTPMNRGLLGTEGLNRSLQQAINPNSPFIGDDDKNVWRQGDRVIQLKNNYDLEIFNGDIGIIVDVDKIRSRLHIRFDDKMIERPLSDMGEMKLAYAISIHKSQGSEFPAVVIPLHTQHWVMLRRNLLYTAITRARKVAFLVGPHRAVRRAVTNSSDVMRYTSLDEQIRREIPPEVTLPDD